MDSLEKSRSEINEIDLQVARLFERRMALCQDIAAYKKERSLSVLDADREAFLLEKCRSNIQNKELETYYVQLQKKMMEVSRQYQAKLISGMRVAYSGVEGAFAYIAAKRMYPEAELVAHKNFSEAYNAVTRGDCDCAVLPLENSYAGEIGTVMDLIFTGELFVNQVIDLPIQHNLLAREGTTIEDIKVVLSHEKALEQCRNYIAAHSFVPEEYSNTALAAKYVKEKGNPSLAAIASEETAQIFGLKILESRINDNQNNTTRFAAFSRVQHKPEHVKMREDESFILVFTVQNKAGALAQTLNIIGAHGYNMKSLRSRPMKDLQWNYYFYIEAEGNINNENGKALLHELSTICARLKLVGSFYN